jgi:glutamate-1-semialdehyde aminotransferase
MANGFPLSAVVGRADVMEAARRTWISSTLASETTGLAAALAVLEWHERAEVCESLWSTGREMRTAVEAAVTSSGAPGVSVDGIDPMWLLRFADESWQQRFLERVLRYGVLLKRGAYNFAAIAHDEEAIADIEQAVSTALVEMMEEEEEAGDAAR